MTNKNRQSVPCDGCTLCCQGDAVRLLPEDNHSLYMTEPHPIGKGQVMLAHAPNGDCIYLDRKKGCTIHSYRPTQCGTMDCRNVYKNIPEGKAKILSSKGLINIEVYNRGKELYGMA